MTRRRTDFSIKHRLLGGFGIAGVILIALGIVTETRLARISELRRVQQDELLPRVLLAEELERASVDMGVAAREFALTREERYAQAFDEASSQFRAGTDRLLPLLAPSDPAALRDLKARGEAHDRAARHLFGLRDVSEEDHLRADTQTAQAREAVFVPIREYLAQQRARLAQLQGQIGDAVVQLRRASLALGALALCAMAATALWTSRRVRGPLKALVAQVRTVTRHAGGDDGALASPQRDEVTELAGAFAAMVRAVREREAALRDSEEKFRSVFERAAVGIARVGLDGRYLEVNDRFAALVGYTRRELEQLHFQAITHPDDLAEDERLMSQLLTGELQGYNVAKRYLRKDGGVAWASLSVGLAHDHAGRPAYCAVVAEDITERRAAEQAQARLAAIVESSDAAIVLKDLDGVMQTWNGAAERLFGYGPDEVVGKNVSLLLPPGRVQEEADILARIRRGDRVDHFETQRVRKDGSVVDVAVTVSPVRDAEGRLVGASKIARDITARKRAEAELAAALRQLQEADRRKNEFLGMLSHELRNPLAPIRNSLFILDHVAPTSEQARRARQVANRQVAHVTRLVDDLLDITRIARGKIALRRADLDLVAVVGRTADDYRSLMSDRRLALEVDLPPERVLVHGDETRLAQVFGNLLSNAAKFTPAGGRVTLSLQVEEERAVVHVRDTGPGIDPEVLPAIFEPFTQGKQTLARSEGGLGLGLSLVKGLVALHGGGVQALSGGRGLGTDFVVTLPRAGRSRAAPEAAEGTQPGRPAAPGRRVLVIDDNRDAADTLAQLVAMLGHSPVVAYDALAGLAKASKDAPDVVLCDLGLPGVDGYEFARQFRAHPAHRGVRLVALSGYAQPEDVTRAMEAGFDAHVAKPADPGRIEEVLA
jgi:PAS domain S-box-containing protein